MPAVSPSASLLDHFSALSDPCQQWRVVYPLPEILLLVLCATLCGMEDFVEIRLWGEQRLDFLRRFLSFERGISCQISSSDICMATTSDSGCRLEIHPSAAMGIGKLLLKLRELNSPAPRPGSTTA